MTISRVPTFFFLALLGACSPYPEFGPIKSERIEAIRINYPELISSLQEDPQEKYCVLHPYQYALPSDYPDSATVNRHLGEIKFQAHESIWAIVGIKGDQVQVSTFHVPRRGGVAKFGEFNKAARDRISKKYGVDLAAGCLSAKDGVILKILFNNNELITFGRK